MFAFVSLTLPGTFSTLPGIFHGTSIGTMYSPASTMVTTPSSCQGASMSMASTVGSVELEEVEAKTVAFSAASSSLSKRHTSWCFLEEESSRGKCLNKDFNISFLTFDRFEDCELLNLAN